MSGGPSLAKNVTRSFRSANYTTRYWQNQSSLLNLPVVTASSTAAEKTASTFTVVAGLADSSGFSFRDSSGHYLRHWDFRARFDANDGTSTFAKDATFIARAGSSSGSIHWRSDVQTTRLLPAPLQLPTQRGPDWGRLSRTSVRVMLEHRSRALVRTERRLVTHMSRPRGAGAPCSARGAAVRLPPLTGRATCRAQEQHRPPPAASGSATRYTIVPFTQQQRRHSERLPFRRTPRTSGSSSPPPTRRPATGSATRASSSTPTAPTTSPTRPTPGRTSAPPSASRRSSDRANWTFLSRLHGPDRQPVPQRGRRSGSSTATAA